MITEDSVVVAKEGLSLADLDGEAVVLAPHTGAYYGLNGVGTRAFELATEPRPVREIVQTIFEEYEADEAVVRDDVLRFFRDMEDLELVEVREGGPSGSARGGA